VRIYEINTWVWLSELSERHGRLVTLDTVPEVEWDALMSYCFDAVWLMGVWQRSPAGRAIAIADPRIREACRCVLPGLTDDDIVASPYCINSYVVEEKLGGPAGLAVARTQLAKRKLKLILDYVPNHSATDHLWTYLHPEYYVRGTVEDLKREPQRYFLADGDNVIARGAPSRWSAGIWTDTAQLDAACPGYRDVAVLTLMDIASQCDGVRCDMAMLLLNDAFCANWSVGPKPAVDFWEQVIAQVRRRYPELVFIAESYSDSEWTLQQQGFDYCYDKDKLYERLANGDAESVRQHLGFSAPQYLAGLLHFLENHDEAPASDRFRPVGRHQLAAVAIATLPGASLWYDRQFEGRWGKVPVELGRSLSIRSFYQRLLRATAHPALRYGEWSWCRVEPVANLLAWCWSHGEVRALIVLNMSEAESWGRVALPWHALYGKACTFRDLFSGEQFGPRDATEILEQGLIVGRPGWGFHLFEVKVER
jgi:hypothetical protein